jgi:site-specific recombinase XerD
MNGKPGNKKDLVASQMIIKLCSQFKDSDDLMIIRDLAMIVLSFAGFLRFDELSSLTCTDVTVHDRFLNLKS